MAFVHFPIKKSIYTVVKSPHIDKKSREQFCKKQYKKKIITSSQNITALCILLHTVRISEFPGVQIKISIHH
ncbi:ribosomal protein S10 (mitochondrion) [Bryopsis sp. KO-2023]|nr:ribosomal protein S10 [Bryopsis sp. KO-2023]